ncbi:MAG TPA: hypothetical protein ENK67_02620 [Flavobacteriia bacterium]|nr:hypothetical protein [Flavobacteriia bacterium]
MNTNNSYNQKNQFFLQNKIEERLKIIESQRQKIKQKKKRALVVKNVLILSLLSLFSSLLFYGFIHYNKMSKIKNKKLQAKILAFQDKKFRDSVSLLAINKEIENRAYKKMMDSIDLVTERKFDSIQNSLQNEKINSVGIFKKRVKKKKTKKIIYQKIDAQNNAKTVDVASSSNIETPKGINSNEEFNKKNIRSSNNNLNKESASAIIKTYVTYPGCESKSEKSACFDKKINKHIKRKLNKKIFRKSGVGKIEVLFTITKNGFIKILTIEGVINEVIRREVIRVIETLPKMKPAMNIYGFNTPINYRITISV